VQKGITYQIQLQENSMSSGQMFRVQTWEKRPEYFTVLCNVTMCCLVNTYIHHLLW